MRGSGATCPTAIPPSRSEHAAAGARARTRHYARRQCENEERGGTLSALRANGGAKKVASMAATRHTPNAVARTSAGKRSVVIADLLEHSGGTKLAKNPDKCRRFQGDEHEAHAR